MPVAFDSVNPDSASGAGVTSLTATAQTVSASASIAIGFIATGDATNTTHTSFKSGGSGGTSLGAAVGTVQNGTHGRLSAYALATPPTGSQAAYGDWGASQGEATIAMLTYTGAAGTVSGVVTNTGGTSDPGGDATATVNVTTEVGDTVIACAFSHNQSIANGPTVTPAGGSTGRYETEGAQMGSFAAMQVIELVATGTTTAMSVDLVAEANHATNWTIIAFVIDEAGAGTVVFENDEWQPVATQSETLVSVW